MPSTTDALLYGIADTLQMKLGQVGAGYKGKESRTITVGPWNLDSTILVKSDVIEKTIASFWVHIRQDLWAYIICHERGEAVNIILFNGSLAKMPVGFMLTPCENGSLKKSLTKLKDIGGFHYAYKNNKWVQGPYPDNL